MGTTPGPPRIPTAGLRLIRRIRPIHAYALVVSLLAAVVLLRPWIPGAQRADATEQGLRIRDLVRQVKRELWEADSIAIHRNETALFELQDFDLDVSFVVHSKHSATGKASYELLAVESTSELATERTQRIHLRWTAVRPDSVRLASAAELPDGAPDVIGGTPFGKGERK